LQKNLLGLSARLAKALGKSQKKIGETCPRCASCFVTIENYRIPENFFKFSSKRAMTPRVWIMHFWRTHDE
jgi:hypothetical protein